MTTTLIRKNLKLAHEFDTYVARSSRALKSLSGGVHVVMTTSSDKKLSEANLSIARSSRAGKFVVAHKSGKRWTIRPYSRKAESFR